MRKRYLKENKPHWYQSMLMTGKLERHLAEIERTVNEVIARNLDVTIDFVPRAEAATIVDLSKLPEDVSDTLRIVRVGDYDACACIGAHVHNTAEIGTFQILSHDVENGRWRVRWKVQ